MTVGTDLYSPPELNIIDVPLNTDELSKIDIWCWGMMLWEILVDGGPFTDVGGQMVEGYRMQELREEGTLAKAATAACRKFLEIHHSGERTMFNPVLKVLEDALSTSAADRPSAASLLIFLSPVVGRQ